METAYWVDQLQTGFLSPHDQQQQQQQGHMQQQQPQQKLGHGLPAHQPWLADGQHQQQPADAPITCGDAGDRCPDSSDPSSFLQDEATYQTFGGDYPHAYNSDHSGGGGQHAFNPLDFASANGSAPAAFGQQQQQQQQLDDATELHPLSFDEIMAAFAQAAAADGGPTEGQQQQPQYSPSAASASTTAFAGDFRDFLHQPPPQQMPFVQQLPTPPISQQQASPAAFDLFPAAPYYAPPAPPSSSGGHPASLSPVSQPSPASATSLPSAAQPFALPYNMDSPQQQQQQQQQPLSVAPHPPYPGPSYAHQHHPPPVPTPPPPPTPPVTMASQHNAFQPFAPARGSRSRVDPSRATGGLHLAASMSLMGVTERDESEDITSGWDDFEFGVHTKPPFAPMVDRVLERGSRFDLGERSLIVMTPKVAQKSYGNEKRFLCPPPSAILAGKGWFDPLITAPDHTTTTAAPVSPTVYFPAELAGATFAAAPPTVSIAISHELPPPPASTLTTWVSAAGATMRFAGAGADDEGGSGGGGRKKSTKGKGKAAAAAAAAATAASISPGPDGQPVDVAVYGTAVNRSVYVTEGVAPADQHAASGDLHTGLHTSGKLTGASRRVVKACVRVASPALPGQDGGIDIGSFESREIKVISKPARKKVSGSNTASAAKGVDLSINHGTLISAFQRHKSQAASTKFLSISDAASFLRSSDGTQLVSDEARAERASRLGGFQPARFEASSAKWDGFIIWKVDVKSRTKAEAHMSVPPEPDWPKPPPLAMPFSPATPAPIHFNHTVVLQCPRTGFISPILVVRRVDEAGRALGGHLAHLDEERPSVPAGEGLGEAISQLQKIAFEVYNHSWIPVAPESAGKTGGFLCIADDDIRTELPADGRQLFPASDAPIAQPAQPPPAPDAGPDPAVLAACIGADASNDGGKVLKRRPSSVKGRGSRSSSVGSVRGRRDSSSSEKAPTAKAKAPEQPMVDNPPRWWIQMKDNAVWTIIGVESVRYNFIIPRLKELQPASLSGPALHLGALNAPVTPLPALLRYLQPKPLGQNEESININGYSTTFLTRTTRKMITLYGTAFRKDVNRSDSSWELFFGHRRAPHVELRCQEVMAAVLPAWTAGSTVPGTPPQEPDKRDRLLSLVRKSDGVMIPSALEYGV